MSRQLAPAAGKNGQQQQPASGTGVGSGGDQDGQQQPQQDLQQESVPITEEEVVGYREQDRFLPINNIQRLMKRSLPDSSKISKDAKECIQEATSEFISFITSEAADRATSEKRKTITGDDILNALKTLGFDEMSEVLLIYLAKYRELQSKEPARKRSRKSSGGSGKTMDPNGSLLDAAGNPVTGVNGTNGNGVAVNGVHHEEEEDDDDDDDDDDEDEEEEEEEQKEDVDDTFDMLDLPSDNE